MGSPETSDYNPNCAAPKLVITAPKMQHVALALMVALSRCKAICAVWPGNSARVGHDHKEAYAYAIGQLEWATS